MKNKIKKLEQELKEKQEALKTLKGFKMFKDSLNRDIKYLKNKINLHKFMDN